jgi:hypothetical protein
MAMDNVALWQWETKVRKQDIKPEASSMATMKGFFGFYF